MEGQYGRDDRGAPSYGRDQTWNRERSGGSWFGRDDDRGSSGRGGGTGIGSSSYRGVGGEGSSTRRWSGPDTARGYSRDDGFFAGSGAPSGEFGEYRGNTWQAREPSVRYETERSGYADRARDSDPHYHSWRQRQVEDLDRDYEEYRRERQARFEDDFGSWRQRRQQKRGLLSDIREHMDVVGNDDEHVGTVDRVAGDRIILTKSDPESGGAHHSLSCSDIDRVEGDRVILECSAAEARMRWRDDSRSRALFEREDQGDMGDRVLDRSFEGTSR